MRKTIYTCDKCGEVFANCNDLWPVAIVIGKPGQLMSQHNVSGDIKRTKDFCRNCLTELFPGYIVSDNSPKMDRDLTKKTIGEKFEEIVREICQEEMGLT